MPFEKLEYEVTFITPAFLGNAEQKGQWRTPPFKALLRRWWRIMEAADCGYDWRELRRREGLLWGNAFLEKEDLPEDMRRGRKNGHCRSLIQIRFRLHDQWKEGRLTHEDWKNSIHEKLGEVAPNPKNPERRLPVDLYLGYGPIDQRTRNLGERRSPAIAPGEKDFLRLQWKDSGKINQEKISQMIALINLFGTLGSRSSNGWGSLQFSGENIEKISPSIPLKDWNDCLNLGWPHAFGKDSKGALIWQTSPQASWEDVMKQLARVLANCRHRAKQFRGPGITGVFLLGYPVQGPHVVRAKGFGPDKRWASQLRFKVIQRNDRGYQGMIYHLPHRPPDPLWNLLEKEKSMFDWLSKNQISVWENVHGWLDSSDSELQRWGGAA